jgi:hypothetical protein
MKYPKIIKTVEEFKEMTSSEVCKLMNSDVSLAIRGNKVGVDRHIIKRYD